MQNSTITEHMEVCSRSIEHEQPLRVAERLIEELDVRDLPVTLDGGPCGVLSERDVRRAHRLGASEDLPVKQVMSEDYYPVMPSTPLAHVVRTMGAHEYESALVVEEGRVKGIFTSGHALRALSGLFEKPLSNELCDPSEVRAMILTEHMHVGALLKRTRSAAREVLGAQAQERPLGELRRRADRLLLAMRAHFELDDRALAPALAELPGYGKERADQLVTEHRRQTQETEGIVRALVQRSQSAETLARKLDALAVTLEAVLEEEKALLLNEDLLRTNGILTECTAG